MLPQQIARFEFSAVPVSRANHFRDAEMIGKAQWSSAKGSESRSKNHAVIGIFRRGDNFFFETARRFIHHEKNKTKREIALAVIPSGARNPASSSLVGSLTSFGMTAGGAAPLLERLVRRLPLALVFVEATARFATEHSVLAHFSQNVRCAIAFAVSFLECVRDVDRDIDADFID